MKNATDLSLVSSLLATISLLLDALGWLPGGIAEAEMTSIIAGFLSSVAVVSRIRANAAPVEPVA